MAQGHCHAVRGVEAPRHVVYTERMAHDRRHLLLRGGAATRYGLLDSRGGVFVDQPAAAQRRSHGHTLRTPQLEHTLDVGPEEWRLERHLARAVLLDERPDSLEDISQFAVRVGHAVHVDVAHDHRPYRAALDLDDAVTHIVCARVDAHDAVCCFVIHCGEVIACCKNTEIPAKKTTTRRRDVLPLLLCRPRRSVEQPGDLLRQFLSA